MSKEKKKRRVWVDIGGGRQRLMEVGVQLSQSRTRAYDWEKPLVSHAVAVQPSQVKEFNAGVAAEGIRGVHYRPDGQVEFSSKQAMQRELKRRSRNLETPLVHFGYGY